ncbi:MAG: lysyl-tRNA synthetase [Micrococcales bacterium]|nr:lysyl-tRNA synthetase [Micrococcales bacterium]NBR55198.1 lysyl-tRNA synthetase [Micrococcales bacterium]NBR61829.1 lysyl-tRNA synthetase [Actinomycetota bacterium]NBT48244.1 lysyl-tRNA synthetase [Actinomycetota bacterium]NBY44013.1 lysyl-tRNA synthetase [Micrococcales bacterium]
MNWDIIGPALLAILPPVGMGFLVYYLFKSIIGADAKERKVRAQIEAEERAKAEARKHSN